MIRRRGLALVVAGGALLGAPASARAALPLDLTWNAPAGCPDGNAVRAELERVVRVRRGRTPPLLTVKARIEQSGQAWVLHLRTARDGVTGERKLQGGSCASLVGAATLVMALAYGEGVEIASDALPPEDGARGGTSSAAGSASRGFDSGGRTTTTRGAGGARSGAAATPAAPTRVDPPLIVRPELDLRPPVMLRPPVAPPSEPEAPEPTLAATPDPEDNRDETLDRDRARREARRRDEARKDVTRVNQSAPPAPDQPLRWALSASGLSGWGPLPKQAFGLGLGLDVGSERWLFNLRAHGSPAVETSQPPGLQLRFASAGGSVSGCARGHLGDTIAVAGCAGAQLTVLRGEAIGAGAASTETAVAPLYAGLASLRFELPIAGSISLQLGGDLAASLERPTFEIRGLGDVFQVPQLAPSVWLGLAARL